MSFFEEPHVFNVFATTVPEVSMETWIVDDVLWMTQKATCCTKSHCFAQWLRKVAAALGVDPKCVHLSAAQREAGFLVSGVRTGEWDSISVHGRNFEGWSEDRHVAAVRCC